jgi:hypothetical protein
MEICHFKGLGLEDGTMLKCVLRKYGNMPFQRPRFGSWDNIKVCFDKVGNVPFQRPRLGKWDNIKMCLEVVWKYAISKA